MNTIVFDLDGTICDSAAAITGSLNHVLSELGCRTIPEQSLLKYIGPRPDAVFRELIGASNKALISSAVELYKDHYINIAYRESLLYSGIGDVLQELRNSGYTLCVATAKPKHIAKKVLEFIGVGSLFSIVLGGDKNREKVDLLKDIISNAESEKSVMIGDRDTDFIAASMVHIPSIAVRWGYGEEKEFELSTIVVSEPLELPDAVIRLFSDYF